MNISKRVENLQPSGIRAFFDLVLGMKDVISLGVGEPDFVTPWNIRESAIFAIERGFTSYTSNKGLYKLRLEISRFLKKTYGLNFDADTQILITVGVSEAMDLAIRTILNPGDKVIIPEPAYVSYAPLVYLAGGVPVVLLTQMKDGFKIDPRHLDKVCGQNKPKAIILNYPANPTGVSYRKKELKALARIILEYKLITISDEIYDELTYDFGHSPFATLKGTKPNTIYLNGFSKSYAMTGWRIGYACGPQKIISGMTKIHQYSMLCAPIVSQMAACEALVSGKNSVEEMKQEYDRRRQFVYEGLNRIGLKCRRPDGAFYIFPSIKSTKLSSMEFANRLLKKQKVAVVPGTAFGDCGEGHIRISYTLSLDNLKQALARIEEFIKRL